MLAGEHIALDEGDVVAVDESVTGELGEACSISQVTTRAAAAESRSVSTPVPVPTSRTTSFGSMPADLSRRSIMIQVDQKSSDHAGVDREPDVEKSCFR